MITGSKVRLREKSLTDAPDDYNWQSDPELARLDAAPLLSMPFPRYLQSYALELRYLSPARCALSIETLDGKHIGNCAYHGIDETNQEAEMGIMIGDRNFWDQGYGADAVNTLLGHIFGQTDLNRIYLKTLDWNLRAQGCFAKCGFTTCGRMRRDGYSFLRMEIRREWWQAGREGS